MTKKPEEKIEPAQPGNTGQAVHPNPRARLGERLSQARQTRDISITDASERLRIRSNYLEALESGEWEPLPEEVYVMGFLRQYASLLGVDISSEIEALKTGKYQLTKPFTMPDPPIAMNRSWAIVASACFVLLLILFNVVDEGEEERTPPPGTLQLAAPDSVPDSPLPQPGPDATAAPVPAPAVTEPAVTEPDKAPATETPVETPAAPAITQQATPMPAAPVSQTQAAQIPAPAQTSARSASDAGTAGSHDYQISAADEDVWLQVHAPDGSLVKEALLRSGQSMLLSSTDAYLLLTAGNPLALKISIDDVMIAESGTLGEKETVLRDFRLTPANSGSAR